MKISTVLTHIDSGFMALPEFQRGYVWNREQVRSLFDSLYRRHPVGGLLVWTTSQPVAHRGDEQLPVGEVKLLLDGQQRMTTLYGVLHGRPPAFFDGNPQTFSNLMFHIESEAFSFYQPIKMKDNSLWIDVTVLMRGGVDRLGDFIEGLQLPADKFSMCVSRLTRLLGIADVDLHVEEVTGNDKSLDIVVDIFNRVNSGGTKLSKGDLALAKICADWPDARESMKQVLDGWSKDGYHFDLGWLLRCLNAVLTGEARFSYLHEKNAEEVADALTRTTRAINTTLNMIDGHLGLDHDRVLFGRYALPVIARYLDERGGALSANERDKLLFWFVQAGMWGRFSGSSESYIDQDLAVLEEHDSPLDGLLEQLRLWHGGLRTEPGHFSGWSLGARFYPVLYMLTRMGDSRDLCSGLPLKHGLKGKTNRLEVHHIFPKSRLYERGYRRDQVNALANFCFLTQDCNRRIANRLPEEYFRVAEHEHPGALASHWIPEDPELWKIENYLDFLGERRRLLATETNRKMETLLHGDTIWIDGEARPKRESSPPAVIVGGIQSEDEEYQLNAINQWVKSQDLPLGQIAFDYTDPESGAQLAVFDLAWPDGLQVELSQPVAILLDEGIETLAIAARAGYRCFTDLADFRLYVTAEIRPTVDVAA